MEPWLQIILTIAGALIGAWCGVKVALAKLEAQMAFVLAEIDRLRAATVSHGDKIADHGARLNFIGRPVR